MFLKKAIETPALSLSLSLQFVSAPGDRTPTCSTQSPSLLCYHCCSYYIISKYTTSGSHSAIGFLEWHILCVSLLKQCTQQVFSSLRHSKRHIRVSLYSSTSTLYQKTAHYFKWNCKYLIIDYTQLTLSSLVSKWRSVATVDLLCW